MAFEQTRVLICHNQVSICIANGLTQVESASVQHVVVYDAKRCDVSMLRHEHVFCIPFHCRWKVLITLLMRWLVGPVEICLPHRAFRNLGTRWFINMFAGCCSQTSVIDDGLDTFRHVPKNICAHEFVQGSKFYTFHYPFPLGSWLDRFKVVPVAHIGTLADVSRPTLDLRFLSCLVIESPPLDQIATALYCEGAPMLVVEHANVHKSGKLKLGGVRVCGRDIALERSISDFAGLIVVGESMTAVFALLCPAPKFRLVVYVSQAHLNNLEPLVGLVRSASFAELRCC